MKSEYQNMIEACQIFLKYENTDPFFYAEHDVIWAGPDPELVSEEDTARLEELGWISDQDGFMMYT